jgi:3-mercaptopyruvate sulfurtransferase SseA
MGKRDKRKTILMLVAGIALITAILAACATPTPQPQAVPASPNAEAPQEVQRITLGASKAAFDNKSAVFLDVRSANAYAVSHIPEALSIPLDELEARIVELDPAQWIITYCT